MLWLVFSDVMCWVAGADGFLALVLTFGETKPIELPELAEGITRAALLFDMEGEVMYRDVLLRCALIANTDCELARWHLGQLRVRGEWTSIERAENLATEDPQHQQYCSLRSEASSHWKRELALAQWCRRQHWEGEERLHLRRVLMNTASNQAAKKEAMRKLGLQLHRGVLLSSADAKRHEREVREAARAYQHWAPRLKKWRKAIEGGHRQKREYALENLRAVSDVSSISALESVMSGRSEQLALEVLSLLKNMPEHEATLSLVRHAMGTRWPNVFEASLNELKRRSLHDYTPAVLQSLIAPIRSTFRVSTSHTGTVRHEHVFFRKGPAGNLVVKRNFVAALRDGPAFAETGLLYSDRRWDVREQVARASQRALNIERSVVQANAALRKRSERLYVVLERTTSMQLPRLPSAWWEWWEEYNEVHSQDKPNYLYEDGRVQYYGLPMTVLIPIEVTSCFAAGTAVRTQTGLVAIEQVQAGDRVLSQNPETGELAYKLVLRTTRRPPSDLLRISIDGTQVSTTKGHPFWVNRLGWRMAKRLRVGYQIHSVEGGRTVDQIDDGPSAHAYNLIVADFGTYFVTEADLLVHDNTYRGPTKALTPGLLSTKALTPGLLAGV